MLESLLEFVWFNSKVIKLASPQVTLYIETPCLLRLENGLLILIYKLLSRHKLFNKLAICISEEKVVAVSDVIQFESVGGRSNFRVLKPI